MAENNVDTESIKCKGCGSNITFDPETQMLKCSYCGYSEDFVKSATVAEINIEDALNTNAVWSDETIVINCPNCGARVVAEKTEMAGLCPFCGTSHVIVEEDLQGIRPNAVVPFAVNKEKCVTNFKGWAKRKLFAPNEFKKKVKADKVRGVYMPFFTFDSSTDSVYDGKVGYTKTRTVRTKNGTRTETYTVWRHISGTFSYFFDDILINAGSNLEEKNAKKLAPFDWSAIKVYDNEYLSGYVAHRYEKSISDCWKEARNTIDSSIRRMIISQYHCDKVAYLNVSTRHNSVTYKYVLLPVYVINYKYKNKNYIIYQNGSTGKTVGKSPVSPWKVTIASVLGVAVLVGIIALFAYFMG